MARQVDPEVLAGFLTEAKGYLPQIIKGIEAYRADSSRLEALEEAYRHIHTISGAAAMMGFSALSNLAHELEVTLEELAIRQFTPNEDTGLLLQQTVHVIANHLDGGLQEGPKESARLIEAARLCRRMRGLGDEETGPLPSVLAPEAPPAPDSYEENQGRLLESASAFIDSTPILGFPDFTSEANPLGVSSRDEEQDAEPISPELLEVFALEAEDHLHTISSRLPLLKQQPDDRECLQEIRRSAHTLKGAAGMVGFQQITQLAHRMEDLLDSLYEGGRSVTPEVIQLLFSSNDLLEDMATGKKEHERAQALYEQYAQMLPDEAQIPSAVPGRIQGQSPTHTGAGNQAGSGLETALLAPAAADLSETEGAPASHSHKQGQFVRIPIERLDDLTKLISELVINRTTFEQRVAELVRQVSDLQPSTSRLKKVAYKLETGYEASALDSGPGIGSARSASGGVNRLHASYQAHGFDDLQFDRYTEFHLLSRELAETTNDVQTTTGELAHLIGDFESCLTRQARLTGEIEDKLMRLRMVPLASFAPRWERTIRNVADQQSKQVDLVLEGETTELDKSVLEEMSDPLMHLLRNAVDHGIEPPEVRHMKGKAGKGTIRLRAYQEGSQVILQITDDGAGIDPEVVRSTAVQRGFLASSDIATLSEEDLLALLFLPGFSTAREVSEISGRGVGLDIVKAQVTKLKGSVHLESQRGRGATFTIRLPMTLAITRALMVKAHQETFAIPLDAIRQIQRLESHEIDRVGKDHVARIGGKIYPLISLAKVLSLKRPADESVARPPVLILNAGAKQVALVVDHILGGREIVIKNLGSHLRHVRGISGATLMGDGSVVLILNPAELTKEAVAIRSPIRPAFPTSPLPGESDSLTVMLVDDSLSVRRVVTSLIVGAGWKATAAKDGMGALEILHQSATVPDLILLDVEMPRMDGYELLSNLRAQDAFRNLPVVMVTSRAGDKHRKKAMDLGASAYVVKPYQDEALINVIRHLVHEARQAVLV
ncbi:MAG: Hpt domain-containing protein [Gemmataceae bacterium]